MIINWKKWNWRAGILPMIAAGYLTYQEIRDDHDNNPSTVFNMEYVLGSWSGVIAILWGTTTAGQTAAIAERKVEEKTS